MWIGTNLDEQRFRIDPLRIWSAMEWSRASWMLLSPAAALGVEIRWGLQWKQSALRGMLQLFHDKDTVYGNMASEPPFIPSDSRKH